MFRGTLVAGGHRKTCASMVDRSSVLNERRPISPPALTIFRLRSLTESSRTQPRRVQPVVRVASVVSRTRAIATFSASSALAAEADASTKTSSHVVAMRAIVLVNTILEVR
jgi:hypothetical protein